MTGPSLGDLHAEIAALRGTTENELKNVNARLALVEATQRELVKLATTGKASLRTLLWVGGLVTAAVGVIATVWNALSSS